MMDHKTITARLTALLESDRILYLYPYQSNVGTYRWTVGLLDGTNLPGLGPRSAETFILGTTVK